MIRILILIRNFWQIWTFKFPKVVRQYLRFGGKWYMSFIGNLVLFPAVKVFLKIGWDLTKLLTYCYEFGGTFFGTRCGYYSYTVKSDYMSYGTDGLIKGH